ncbi:hypothetical protein GQ53DRAFT_796478 [Thozetella sp. PMI_491]|nr:hypothetical protein GQ53DRAFT_796478 [Thozetella sp. PMI_491]
MASVKSLGVQSPIGLRHAIEEGILPEDPPASAYTWESSVDADHQAACEDELLVTKQCVIWSRGGLFRKAFNFKIEKEPVTQALLTYFPSSPDHEGDSEEDDDGKSRASSASKPDEHPPLSRALVVFLKTQAHIYFLSGTSHVVHMPFEVESACAAPVGVIIQGKSKPESFSPLSLKLPKVPPNSFISPMSSPFAPRSSQLTAFSTDGLGQPKTLPLRLTSTLENMWQPPLETTSHHWPRLVCLTDPLLEIGLVVAEPDQTAAKNRQQRAKTTFLDPSEEILHVEGLRLPGSSRSSQDDLIIAVTVNRLTNMYTIWTMSYIHNDDIFIGRQKTKSTTSRRRSSMAPPLVSGAASPPHPGVRESFGAPLPGKRSKKGEKKDKALDNALSSLDPEKGGDITRRQSRRVSSLLARADLSVSQERSSFADQQHAGAHATRRNESHGSQRSRMSGGYGGVSFSGTFNHSLNSLTEAPIDNLLEELRAGGDFEGFHNMGLEDHEFDGLTRELLFSKVHCFAMDNSNVRYSLSNKPASSHSKVFVLVGPACSTDEEGRTQILVGIQDPLDKRLQLLTLHAQKRNTLETPGLHRASRSAGQSEFAVTFGQLRRAQSVVDSCKLSDGDDSILILSEDKAGKRELSLQAAWSQLTSIELPLLFFDNLDSLDYSGRHMGNKEVRGRRSVGVGISTTHIEALCHSKPGGLLDFQGKDGRFHRVRVRLQPSGHLVCKALDACRSVLHPSFADKMLPGWWHVVQWRRDQAPRAVNLEWSSWVILLFASFLSLAPPDSHFEPTSPTQTPRRRGSNWPAMRTYDSPNSSAYPPWARSQAWTWMLELGNTGGSQGEGSTFVSRHIQLAKQYLNSAPGISAFGPQGYMPTARSRDDSVRTIAASGIVLALHLLLEEQKLDIMSPEDLSPGQTDLRVVIWQVVRWLDWSKFVAVYELGMQPELDPSYDFELQHAPRLAEPTTVPSMFDWIQERLTKESSAAFLEMEDVFSLAVGQISTNSPRRAVWQSLTPRTSMFVRLFSILQPAYGYAGLVVAMHESGFTPKILETLPEAILAPLQDAISMSQPQPPSSWSKALLQLVNRPDIISILKASKTSLGYGPVMTIPDHVAKWDFQMLCQHLEDPRDLGDDAEGSERQAIVRAMFKEDRRLNEAQDLLSSHKLRVLRLPPNRDWSEAEYLEKQKELVATMANSTLAIPSGRGLLYYALRCPLLTQKFHIGGFNLSCTVKPANNIVGVDKNLFTEEKINWAFFHQGVAGGLAISPQAKGIDTSWILYNKPGQDLSNRHAGFLLALGLNGHLKSVAKWVAFKYLTPKHTMTSIGLLLGLAASYMGTMDSLITRLLSVHVTRMLPRGSAELNLSKHTQTTGIMGIGLLYCNSQHRRMSEIMMSEIEYVEDDTEEDPLRDEGYRLAAGFALGFINLGKGTDLKGLHDMRLTEKLLTIATATKRVELAHVLDRAASAAVIAIALIFMKSEDQIVARKIDVPESTLQFDYARPDILLLRTLAKNLILWSKINPSHDWIKKNLPEEYQSRFRLTDVAKLQSTDLAFYSILAGLCFAIGLRFAGSGNQKVRDLLVHYLDQFIRIVKLTSGQYDAELARGNVRMCLNVLALSCATVMAGTGDLVVFRRLRSLHGRDDTKTTYGSHMAAHLAIGALFLGCGSITFDTSNLAIASLLVAFYPLFPKDVQDNRSHLQAFRHFWVLATDPRCLVTKDFTTGQPVSVPVLIYLRPRSQSAKSTTTKLHSLDKTREPFIICRQTPCLLPPLDDVLLVRTDAAGQGFWNLDVDFENKPELVEAFRANQSLYLRRRPTHEGAFSATLRALGREAVSDRPSAGERDPMEWVFGLDALKSLTHAERALVVDRFGSGGGVGEGEGASTAVDARLVLDAGIYSWSRDRLLGLRLLFEWADRRALSAVPSTSEHGESESKMEKSRRDKSKGKKVDVKRGKKKVSVAGGSTETSLALSRSQGSDVGGNGPGGAWWIRDSVIEELKGKTWLAG